MKIAIWIIYFAAWIAHGLILSLRGITSGTWEYWALTGSMAIAGIFVPSHWR